MELTKRPQDGYQLTEDLVDDAIAWLGRQQSIAPDKPYSMYFATGAVHSPLHAPKEWIDRFKGRFDQGWDKVPEETLTRQKALGVVPANTRLTPRPAGIPAWDSLANDAQRLHARHQEVFAGFLAYTDFEVGRLIAAIEALPNADNTLIVYIAGDNGPSAEGSLTGTLNSMMTQNGVPDSVENQLPKLEEIGGPLHENHYPVGWAWAGSSPFQWMKRVPSHFGGTRNGMVVAWPKRITDQGGVRTQFEHVIDVVPTILEAAGLPEPTEVDGTRQTPIAGMSMLASFTDPAASGRSTQYLETGGHRAIYHDGWVAASFHGVPWELTGSIGFDHDKWELYDIEQDFSEAVDLAARNPAKLAELQALFDQETQKYEVFPLDDRFPERAGNPARPSFIRGRTQFTYAPGMVRIPEGNAPPVYQRSHKITAEVEIPDGGADGVIVATGGSSGGYTLFLERSRPIYEYNFFGQARYRVEGKQPLSPGAHELVLDYEQRPFVPYKEVNGGPAKLSIDGKTVAEGEVAQAVPLRFSATETLDIGMDLGSTVSPDYRERAPYPFTGAIRNVVIEIAPTQPIEAAQ